MVTIKREITDGFEYCECGCHGSMWENYWLYDDLKEWISVYQGHGFHGKFVARFTGEHAWDNATALVAARLGVIDYKPKSGVVSEPYLTATEAFELTQTSIQNVESSVLEPLLNSAHAAIRKAAKNGRYHISTDEPLQDVKGTDKWPPHAVQLALWQTLKNQGYVVTGIEISWGSGE